MPLICNEGRKNHPISMKAIKEKNMKKNYIFKFKDFVKESLKKKKTRASFLKYGKYFGSLVGTPLEDTNFYKNYLSKFDVSGWRVACPYGLEKDYDYELLIRLIVASFSSDYELHLDERWRASPVGPPLVDICLFARSEVSSAKKFLQDLSPTQIYTLYDIYLREQIDISSLYAEESARDRREGDAILIERRMKLKKYEMRKRALLLEAAEYRQTKVI